MAELCGPVIDYLKEIGEARSVTQIEEHMESLTDIKPPVAAGK